MNQKSKELAEQADFYIPNPPYLEGDVIQILRIEKLFEMVIKDVLSEVWDEVQYSTSQGIANEIDDKLKKYYGVKE